ncbi:hypothetical protein DFH07DRAFT_776083 [Mycena maculata]|uniref:Uncharacterized protein n=1 Tax=Mycena maculata TaxID=230809 RepID=A0AAD7INI7_9AGAR|nr:hypothetical protein DFH07DRAFT_776083 [Mycena maculata]
MLSSSPSTGELFREFAICASLSFIVILGVLHALLRLLHVYFVSGLALRWPLVKVMTTSAFRISQITTAHAYLLVVFELTIACTVLVFAVREISLAIGASRGGEGDLEAGEERAAAPTPEEEIQCHDEEKLSLSKPTHFHQAITVNTVQFPTTLSLESPGGATESLSDVPCCIGNTCAALVKFQRPLGSSKTR